MATRKKTAKKATPKRKTARAKTPAKAAKKSPARRSAAKPARAAARKTSKTASGLQLAAVAPSLTVNDIAESLAWYCDVVGFVVKEKWERDGILVGGELRAGNVTLYLGRDDWQKGRDRVKGEGFRIYWTTDQDIDKLAAGIVARGGTLASEPKDGWGMRSFELVDPTGYKITVSSRR